MEYQRKIRWANYETPKCKEYLRNDFSHECAYCRLQEREAGLIDSSYFEIDHFRPQSDDDKTFNPHIYNNLYYSCERCNGEKSDKWSNLLLDPCRDDVFSGSNPPVVGGYDPTTFYKYFGQNDKGIYYINTFKLNSRYHLKIRKQRNNRKNNIRQIDALVNEILFKFKQQKNSPDLEQLIYHLDQLRQKKSDELSLLSKDENFEAVENYLDSREIKHSTVFEEYNMDIKIKPVNESFYAELIVDNTIEDNDEKIKFIETGKLKVWFEVLQNNFGILYFYPKLDKLYFYPVSNKIEKEKLDDFGTKKQIKLTVGELIT